MSIRRALNPSIPLFHRALKRARKAEMQPSITAHPPRRRFTAWAAIAALTLSGAASWTAPTAQAAETTYPWSKVASTGDYIADSYADVDSGHVL